MRRRRITVALVVVALAAAAAPAGAAKKKPRRVTFEATGVNKTFAPSSRVLWGVTEREFLTSCTDDLVTNGMDATVVRLPKAFLYGGEAEVTGSSAGPYDLDVYYYSGACDLLEPYMNDDGPDEVGSVAPLAAFAVIDSFLGVNTSFTFTATAAPPPKP